MRSSKRSRRAKVSRVPTAGRGSGSTRRGSRRPTPRSRSRTCSAATGPQASIPLTEPILTYPVLHYQNGGLVIDEHGETTRRGPLRLRRDRGRHPRPEPDDGQLAPRVLRLRPTRRQGRRGEGRGMSTVATDIQTAVRDAAAHLYVWALKDIPQDLRDALVEARGRETSTPGQRVLDTIIRNVESPTRRRTSSARTRGSPSTTAGSASTSRCTRPGSTRRSTTARSARLSSIRCARTPSTR